VIRLLKRLWYDYKFRHWVRWNAPGLNDSVACFLSKGRAGYFGDDYFMCGSCMQVMPVADTGRELEWLIHHECDW
jgi:hypothetical protein